MLDHRHARRAARAVVIVAGCLLLLGQLGSTASAAGRDDRANSTHTIKLKVGVTQADLNRLRSAARSAGEATAAGRPRRPQASSRARISQGAGPPLALGRGEALSRERAADAPPSVTQPSPVAGVSSVAPIGEQPDGGLVDECFAGDGVERSIGRVHNRFTFCLRNPIQVEYWSVDNRGVPIEREGDTEANLEVFAQGDNTDRKVRVFARLQEDSVDYDWGPFDNLFVAPNVPLSLIGQCRQDFDVCNATRGAATLPWTVWDNNSDWFYWDVVNREESGEGRDKISYNQWLVEFFTETSEFHTLFRGRTFPRMIRCDSATYFNQGPATYPKACVFSETIPRLMYRLGSEHHSVAFHIFTAQFHPNDTYPLLVPFGVPRPRDKRIPGRYVADNPLAPGLHRITEALHPGEILANEQHKNDACAKRGPYFDTGLPVPPGPGEDCDEYPFRSTLEGAAHPDWDFSVKAVPLSENRSAGAALRNYYVDDRILAWDPELNRPNETNDRFYVHIP